MIVATWCLAKSGTTCSSGAGLYVVGPPSIRNLESSPSSKWTVVAKPSGLTVPVSVALVVPVDVGSVVIAGLAVTFTVALVCDVVPARLEADTRQLYGPGCVGAKLE